MHLPVSHMNQMSFCVSNVELKVGAEKRSKRPFLPVETSLVKPSVLADKRTPVRVVKWDQPSLMCPSLLLDTHCSREASCWIMYDVELTNQSELRWVVRCLSVASWPLAFFLFLEGQMT